MDNVTRKRLEDIQRLMSAAGSVGEAEAAAAAFQRLIFKHNITAEDLAGLGQQKREAYEGLFIRVAPERKPGIQWRLNLVYVLARYNFCAFIRYGHHGSTGVIVGQPSNQEGVRAMFDSTVDTVERLAESEWSALRNSSGWISAGCPSKMGWQNSFKIGFATGLNIKMNLERSVELKEDHRAAALVVVKDSELAEAIETVVGKTGSHKGSEASNKDGYRRGVEKGREHQPQATLGHGYKELAG